MENDENQQVEDDTIKIFLSNLLITFFFLMLILCFVLEFQCYLDNKNNSYANLGFDINILFIGKSIQKSICWIFDDKVKYQALLSLGSIVISNPNQRFNFYFILPPGMNIDLEPFNQLINFGSKIYVRNYQQKHTYLSIHSQMKCRWSGIIIVKLWLFEILPELDEVLYLDTDVMNMAPIGQLWEIDLQNKAFGAVTKFEAETFYWINSGVILYNLKELRKKDQSLWYCANKHSCFIDDEWHTRCHPKESVYPLPLRYNIEMVYIKKPSVTKLHEEEKNKTCLVHLKDTSQVFYSIQNKNDIPKMEVVEGHPLAIKIMQKLFTIREKIDNIVHL
ncbi:hypothetical protein M9Y10_010900 [Tritrichomonas musculus]|uniref:Nucleotide-diphospho-sugar transferase domain-containing protein n=1 Tax=Tritrichomonas musculus TaxID=1915356 RepID=A0ABR2IN77_9EUKA